MTWSQAFKAFIAEKYGEHAQDRAARSLRVAASSVSYWCRGSLPRQKMRERIERWSDGKVPAELVVPSKPSTPPKRAA